MNPLSIIIFILGYTLVLGLYNFFADTNIDKALMRTDLPEKLVGKIQIALYASLYLILPLVVYLFGFHLKWWQAGLAAIGSGIFSLIIIGVVDKQVAKYKMKPAQGASPDRACQKCGREIFPQDTILQAQALYVQTGDSSKAREIEKQAGYRCIQCGAEYCKGCLEKHATVNSAGGRSCLNCGGSFDYITRKR